MNPIDIITEAEQDLKIDYNGDLGIELQRQIELFTKYTSELKKHTLKLKAMYQERQELESELWIYYTGKASPDVYKQRPMDNRFLKSEVKDAIASDTQYQALQWKIIVQEEIVDAYERIVKEVNNRQWNIKNMIEWKKFIEGA